MKPTNKPRAKPARKSPAKKMKSKAPARRGRGRKRAGVQRLGRGIAHKSIAASSAGATTHSSYSLKHRSLDARCRAITLIGDVQRFVNNNTYKMTGVAGSQAAEQIQIASQVFLRELADANTDFGNVTDATRTAAPPRYVLQNVTQILSFSNQSSAPVVMRIYALEVRRDTQEAGAAYIAPSSDSYTLGNSSPIAMWNAGLSAQQNTGSTNSGLYAEIGVRPTDSVIFNKYFAIKQVATVQLAPAGTHRYECRKEFNQFIDASIYCQNALASLAGLTHWSLITAEGVPVSQPGQDSPLAVGVTTAPISVDIVEQSSYHWTYATPYRQNMYVNDNVLTVTNANQTSMINTVGASISVLTN